MTITTVEKKKTTRGKGTVCATKISASLLRRKSKSDKTLNQYGRSITAFVKWLKISHPSSITEDETVESYYRLILPISNEVRSNDI